VNVLLVPAHPGFPGQIPQSRKTVVCVCVFAHVLRKEDNDWRRNICSMKWRVPGHEVDQRKLGERLRKKTVRHIN